MAEVGPEFYRASNDWAINNRRLSATPHASARNDRQANQCQARWFRDETLKQQIFTIHQSIAVEIALVPAPG